MNKKLLELVINNYMAIAPRNTVVSNIIGLHDVLPAEQREHALMILTGLLDYVALNADVITINTDQEDVKEITIIPNTVTADPLNNVVHCHVEGKFTDDNYFNYAASFPLSEWNTGFVTWN